MATVTSLFKKALEVKYLLVFLSLGILMVIQNMGVLSWPTSILAIVFLGVSVMTSVHHAEIIAHKIGEGLGTLLLALCVTIIEVGMIVSLMGQDGPESSVLARDTVFAAVMIVTNGIVGLCLILGGLKFKEQKFQIQGTKGLLEVLMVLSFIIFLLPNTTTTTLGPTYSKWQMIFIAFISVLLYLLFVFFQTTSHKSYFGPLVSPEIPGENLVSPPSEISNSDSWWSFISLCIGLVAVIGFAKLLSPTIERGLVFLGAPKSSVGLLIASIVLLPETWAAVNAARANRLQTSLNLALGSGIASIALTIPVVIAYGLFTGRSLTLGLDPKNQAFMIMTFLVGIITLGTGRSTLLQGAIHGVILLTYFLMSFIP